MPLEQVTKNLGEIKDKEGNIISPARSVTAGVNLGATLEEAKNLFGEPSVYSAYRRNAVISVQSFLASCLKQNMEPAAIQIALDSWKLGVGGTTTVINEATMLSAFDTMNPEQQQAYLKNLQAKVAASRGK